jgi:ribosomal protein S18 acetylase RimI-like enzyme
MSNGTRNGPATHRADWKTMIRPTTPEETTLLVRLTEATGLFKPMEVEALTEVFADYFAGDKDFGHRSITAERDGQIMGFAYYAPAAMTDRTWYLYWIAVRKDLQARGIGTELLQFVEQDIREQRGRVLFIETGSLPHYEKTRSFYVKNNYETHALLKDYYADGDSMVVFRKAL